MEKQLSLSSRAFKEQLPSLGQERKATGGWPGLYQEQPITHSFSFSYHLRFYQLPNLCIQSHIKSNHPNLLPPVCL